MAGSMGDVRYHVPWYRTPIATQTVPRCTAPPDVYPAIVLVLLLAR